MMKNTSEPLEYITARRKAEKSIKQINKLAPAMFEKPVKEYKKTFKQKHSEFLDELKKVCPNIIDEYAMGYALATDNMLTGEFVALYNAFSCTVNAAFYGQYTPGYNWEKIKEEVNAMYHSSMNIATLLHNIIQIVLPEFKNMLAAHNLESDYEMYCAENIFVEEAEFEKYCTMIKKTYPENKLSSAQKKRIENEEIHRYFIPLLVDCMSKCFNTTEDEININLSYIISLAVTTGFYSYMHNDRNYLIRYTEGALLGYKHIYHKGWNKEDYKEYKESETFLYQLMYEVLQRDLNTLNVDINSFEKLHFDKEI